MAVSSSHELAGVGVDLRTEAVLASLRELPVHSLGDLFEGAGRSEVAVQVAARQGRWLELCVQFGHLSQNAGGVFRRSLAQLVHQGTQASLVEVGGVDEAQAT